MTLFKNGFFKEELLKIAKSEKLEDIVEVRDFNLKLNDVDIGEISSKCKLKQAQVARAFDIIYLSSLNLNNDMHITAFHGYLRRKLEKSTRKQLFKKIKRKYVEFLGDVEEIDYSQFQPTPQDRKYKIFNF